jgi:RNA polymerase sigma factor (sigma-70 family)
MKMNPQINGGQMALLLHEFRTEINTSRSFSKILVYFQPKIEEIASSFPEFWKKDFIQEGTIGLYRALQLFPLTSPALEFPYYATTAIRFKMFDFYKSTIGKFMVELFITNEEGVILGSKHSIVITPRVFINEEGEFESFIDQIPSTPDFVTSLTLAIDVKLSLDERALKKNHFSEKEISVVILHHNQGHRTTEVAKYLKISVSNTSKLIRKTNNKLRSILSN